MIGFRINVSAHDLRRTFATIADNTEMSVHQLKGLLHHSVGQDVTAGYVQISVDDLRKPMQRVTDKLKTLCKVEKVVGKKVVRIAG